MPGRAPSGCAGRSSLPTEEPGGDGWTTDDRPAGDPGLDDRASLAAELRAAGCVFAEDEARILLEAAEAAHISPTAQAADAADSAHHVGWHATLRALVDRRVAGEPLEHIVGWVDFAGLRLHVAPGVFVPRQRTAMLAARSVLAVSEAVKAGVMHDADSTAGTMHDADSTPGPQDNTTAARGAGAGIRFLEAFCGVGPVATAVARAVPEVWVHLGDHDTAALDCAQTNVGPEGTCHLLDGLSGLPEELRGRCDVIAAVPPYVPEHASEFLPREALEGEAPSSLFGGSDGLDHARRLIDEAPRWLRETGVLLIELGREQALVAAEFAATAGGEAVPRQTSEAGHTTFSGFEAHTVLGDDEQTVVLELRPAVSPRG